MKNFKKIALISGGIILSSQAMAEGLSAHLGFGLANAHFSGKTQNIEVVPSTVENQYAPQSHTYLGPAFNAGLAYQWDAQPIALNLGLSFYVIQTTASGGVSPFTNGGSFDSLDYSADGTSYALMLEPKFILTSNPAWQPYLLTGVGVSINRFVGYSEAPSDASGTASGTQVPFGAQSKTNFAYEFGIGLQHPLSDRPNAAILAVDYRYMSLGQASLGDVPGVPHSNLDLGRLSTQMATLSITWPL